MKNIDRKYLVATAMAALSLGAFGCSLENPDHWVRSAEFTADGTPLLFFGDGLASVDSELKVSRWTKYPPPPAQTELLLRRLATSRDGRRAVASRWVLGATGGTPPQGPRDIVEVFDVADGRVLMTTTDHDLQVVALSEHGDLLLAQGEGRTSAISVPDGQTRWSVPYQANYLAPIPGANAVAALFAETSGEPPVRKVRILELNTGAVRREIDVPPTAQSFGVSSDGAVLVVGYRKESGGRAVDAHYLVFGADDGLLRRELVVPEREPVAALVVSPGGRIVGAQALVSPPPPSTSPYADQVAELLLFDGDALTFRKPLYAKGYPNPLALSPDATKLILVGRSSPESAAVTVYQVPSGTPLVSRSYKQDLF